MSIWVSVLTVNLGLCEPTDLPTERTQDILLMKLWWSYDEVPPLYCLFYRLNSTIATYTCRLGLLGAKVSIMRTITTIFPGNVMLLYDLCISVKKKHLLLWKKAQKAKIISLGKVNLSRVLPIHSQLPQYTSYYLVLIIVSGITVQNLAKNICPVVKMCYL